MSGKPFVVTFTLANAMVEPKGPMALDALLSWASVRRAECAGHPQPFSVEHDLPLERHSVGDAWCFKASNLSFEWVGDRSRTVYTKRQQADDYIEAVMKGAMSEFMDGQFIDPAKAESAESPASILKDAPKIVASGITADAIRSDLRKLRGELIKKNVSLTGCYYVMSETMASFMSDLIDIQIGTCCPL